MLLVCLGSLENTIYLQQRGYCTKKFDHALLNENLNVEQCTMS
jgi:hypothetical protein